MHVSVKYNVVIILQPVWLLLGSSQLHKCATLCVVNPVMRDVDYVFPGSDDEFDADELQEEYDILDREQDQGGPGLDDSPPCSPLLHSPTSTSLSEDPQSGPSSSVQSPSTAHRSGDAGSGRGPVC